MDRYNRCMKMLPLLLAACGPVEETLALGTGTSAFTDLADDDEVALVYGPQGGWHVDVALLCTGDLDPDGVVVRYGAEEAGVPISYPVEVQLAEALVRPTADGWERLGDRVVFDVAADTDVLGATLDLWATVEGGGPVETQRVRV
ncbi:MAG: hypothetical protein KC656_02945, partial [Myxococcales bacterium]|nr:hypothetical protein [Myxococcales bacterium]